MSHCIREREFKLEYAVEQGNINTVIIVYMKTGNLEGWRLGYLNISMHYDEDIGIISFV